MPVQRACQGRSGRVPRVSRVAWGAVRVAAAQGPCLALVEHVGCGLLRVMGLTQAKQAVDGREGWAAVPDGLDMVNGMGRGAVA